MSGIQILGTGYARAEKEITNNDLAMIVDTSDEWIQQRTGIAARRITETENTSDLAVRAAEAALIHAGISKEEIRLIIVATSTPDDFVPSTACHVQKKMGLNHENIYAFDLNAACSGFVFALQTAAKLLEENETALVIGAETLSKIVDWKDRNTCVLFADGAGACVVRKKEECCLYGISHSVIDERGVLKAKGIALGTMHQKDMTHGYVEMDGREVFRFAVTAMQKSVEVTAEKAGWSLSDIDLIIPHQANSRIIAHVAKRLGLPLERFFINVQEFGNTSAASAAIALAQADETGLLKKGMKVVIVGFGAGLTYGAVCMEW